MEGLSEVVELRLVTLTQMRLYVESTLVSLLTAKMALDCPKNHENWTISYQEKNHKEDEASSL